MIFNSYSFILIFLPLIVALYFFISKYFSSSCSRLFFIAASLFFMSAWNVYFAFLLMGSVLFNYALSLLLSGTNGSSNPGRRKAVFFAAISGNILLLGFFKYSIFFSAPLIHFFQPIWDCSMYWFPWVSAFTRLCRSPGLPIFIAKEDFATSL